MSVLVARGIVTQDDAVAHGLKPGRSRRARPSPRRSSEAGRATRVADRYTFAIKLYFSALAGGSSARLQNPLSDSAPLERLALGRAI
jgi:hypothetical protein